MQRKMIAKRNLSDIAEFKNADAFDEKSLAGVDPKPTIAVKIGETNKPACQYQYDIISSPNQNSSKGLEKTIALA